MNFAGNDRRLRVQYANAIYHSMSRGVQRSNIFLDQDDRMAFFFRCEQTVKRFGWRVYSAVQMTNHFHLLFQTPEPNLCRGAQYLLGPYAQSFNRRHRRSGHVFEGRYRCRVVENESYLWGVSRYDHLNPVPVLQCVHIAITHVVERPKKAFARRTHALIQ
jgi:putative transposase